MYASTYSHLFVSAFNIIIGWICVAAAGYSGISTAFNAMSLHGTCTAVFVVVAAILGFLTSSIRTLGKISWLAWIGVISIVVARRWPIRARKSDAITNLHSVNPNHRGRPTRTTRSSTPNRRLQIRLQTRRQPLLHRSTQRHQRIHLRLRRNPRFLRHHL